MSAWDALDVFRHCRFLRVVGKIMLLIVVGIVALSWYAVWLEYGLRVGAGGFEGLLSLCAIAVFSALCGMLLWSYYICSVTDPGRVPPGWLPFEDPEVAAEEQQRMNHGCRRAGDALDLHRPRFCKKCQAWKPERAHHCSMLGICVLRMDHYCVWVANTVGLLNYKSFLLFIFYTMLAAALACALLVPSFVRFFQLGEFDDVTRAIVKFMAFVLDAAFTISLAGFMVMHGRMMSKNKTTIETYEKASVSPWPYDKGSRRNFEEVLGHELRQWLVPSYSPQERQRVLDLALGGHLLADERSLHSFAR